MRKINAILGPLMIVFLLIHIISGAFQLYGLIPGGSVIRSVLSWILLFLVAVHAVLGVVLTVTTLRDCRRSGVSYVRNNQRFWIARMSGFAMLLLIVWHLLVFASSSGEMFRLHAFGWMQMAGHILLVLVLMLHLTVNIRPLFIALGIADRRYIKDILIVLSIIALVCAAAFVVYYLRWNILWRYGS